MPVPSHPAEATASHRCPDRAITGSGNRCRETVAGRPLPGDPHAHGRDGATLLYTSPTPQGSGPAGGQLVGPDVLSIEGNPHPVTRPVVRRHRSQTAAVSAPPANRPKQAAKAPMDTGPQAIPPPIVSTTQPSQIAHQDSTTPGDGRVPQRPGPAGPRNPGPRRGNPFRSHPRSAARTRKASSPDPPHTHHRTPTPRTWRCADPLPCLLPCPVPGLLHAETPSTSVMPAPSPGEGIGRSR